MLKRFQCPTCAAPLTFEGKLLIDCNYCGGSIIAPADIVGKDEIENKRKLESVEDVIDAVFGIKGTGPGGSYVIDLRSSSKKAQQNLGSAVSEIQNGHQMNAVNVFTQTFGVDSPEAEKIVDAIGHGKGFDASALRIYPGAKPRSQNGWIIKLVVIGIIVIFVVPLLVIGVLMALVTLAS